VKNYFGEFLFSLNYLKNILYLSTLKQRKDKNEKQKRKNLVNIENRANSQPRSSSYRKGLK